MSRGCVYAEDQRAPYLGNLQWTVSLMAVKPRPRPKPGRLMNSLTPSLSNERAELWGDLQRNKHLLTNNEHSKDNWGPSLLHD